MKLCTHFEFKENNYYLQTSIERFESSLTQNIQKQTTRLQLALLHGLIEDSVQIDRWWFEKKTNPDIIQRLNQRFTKILVCLKIIENCISGSLRHSTIRNF